MARTKMTAEQGLAELTKTATALGAAIKTRDSASFNYLRLGIKLASDGTFKDGVNGKPFGPVEYWETYKTCTGWKGTEESHKKAKSQYGVVFTFGATASPQMAAYALTLADTDLKAAEDKLAKKYPAMQPYSRFEQVTRMVPKLNEAVKNGKSTLDNAAIEYIVVRKTGVKSDTDPLVSLQKHMTSIGTLVHGPKNKPEEAKFDSLAAEFDALQSKVNGIVAKFNKAASKAPAKKNGSAKVVPMKKAA